MPFDNPEKRRVHLSKRRKEDAEWANDQDKKRVDFLRQQYQNDPDFRKRQAERLKGYRATSRNCRFASYQDNAKTKGNDFQVTKEQMFLLFEKACHYCGCTGTQGGGVDRVDNKKGYTTDNVVPCCTTCNYMKRVQGPEEFIAHICSIVEKSGASDVSQCKRSKRAKVNITRRAAASRNLRFDLTQEVAEGMVMQKCYYCNALPHPVHGIDRLDNDGHYTDENVVTSCVLCNRMKKKSSVTAFMEHVQRIYAFNITPGSCTATG